MMVPLSFLNAVCGFLFEKPKPRACLGKTAREGLANEFALLRMKKRKCSKHKHFLDAKSQTGIVKAISERFRFQAHNVALRQGTGKNHASITISRFRQKPPWTWPSCSGNSYCRRLAGYDGRTTYRRDNHIP
jgi:hypothetical protein